MYVTYDIQELPFPASCRCLFLDDIDIVLCMGVLLKNNTFMNQKRVRDLIGKGGGVNYIPTNENMHVRIATTS